MSRKIESVVTYEDFDEFCSKVCSKDPRRGGKEGCRATCTLWEFCRWIRVPWQA